MCLTDPAYVRYLLTSGSYVFIGREWLDDQGRGGVTDPARRSMLRLTFRPAGGGRGPTVRLPAERVPELADVLPEQVRS